MAKLIRNLELDKKYTFLKDIFSCDCFPQHVVLFQIFLYGINLSGLCIKHIFMQGGVLKNFGLAA